MERLVLMAHFNAWANTRLYKAVDALTPEAVTRPRGLFFSSILGTLNHLLVVDRLWNGRLEGQDHGDLRLDTLLYGGFATLRPAREAEDARLIRIVEQLDEKALTRRVEYRRIIGRGREHMRCDHILLTVYNHQTYHRGQVVAALNQDDIEPLPMDVGFYLDELGWSD